MSKGRLEAFSDGVLAIIITIMVLELEAPHGAQLADLRPLVPVFSSYVLSFAFVGIYFCGRTCISSSGSPSSPSGPPGWAPPTSPPGRSPPTAPSS